IDVGGEVRFLLVRGWIGDMTVDPDGARMNDAFNGCMLRGFEDVTRTFEIDIKVSLVGKLGLAVECGTVEDVGPARGRVADSGGIGDLPLYDTVSGLYELLRSLPVARRTDYKRDLSAILEQARGKMPADESGSTSDETRKIFKLRHQINE